MRKNRLHMLVQFRSASKCTSQNQKTVCLRLKYLPHKQEDLSSVYRMHMLVIRVPGKQIGRPLELSRQSSEFEASQPGLHNEDLSKKKWIATEE